MTAARAITPLADLTTGNRVLYADSPADPDLTECTWQSWQGSIATSLITCGPDTFETPTGRLTPVEPRSTP